MSPGAVAFVAALAAAVVCACCILACRAVWTAVARRHAQAHETSRITDPADGEV